MGDFRKFPEERQRLQLDEEAAAHLAREMLAAAGRPRGEELPDDPYASVAEDPAQWPGPPPAFAAPRGGEQGEESVAQRRTYHRPNALSQVNARRTMVYPEHVVIGGIWLVAVVAGLWRVLH